MGMQRKSILVIFLIFLIPSTVFAEGTIKTGYDLYENIKLMDTAQSPADFAAVLYSTGYLAGFLDGLQLTQDALFNLMFPSKFFSQKERKKLSEEINFHRVNIPEGGLATGQLILIFKKYAEKNPEKLNESARSCVFLSLIESYGWK